MLANPFANELVGPAMRRSLPVPGMADRPPRRIWLGAAIAVLLIVVAVAAPAVSAAGQEDSVQPGRPAVNSVQVLPKVTEAARPKESGKEKPPTMVLQVDLWGHVRFVPEKPGC